MEKCINCGRELTQRQTKYCCYKCQQSYEQKQWVERWKNGDESGLRGSYQVSSHIRTYLFEKYGSKCAQCGWGEVNPFTGNVPLEIEHIDGIYSTTTESNLTLLCPNCHSLTATYKGANRGKGREGRKKYYPSYANPEQE